MAFNLHAYNQLIIKSRIFMRCIITNPNFEMGLFNPVRVLLNNLVRVLNTPIRVIDQS